MPCDLDVDTAAIRAAAAAAEGAADLFRQPAGLPEAAAIRHFVCHGSASARETLRLTLRRTEEGLSAALQLAEITAHTAGSLDAAAASFDQAEALCRSGM